MTPEQESAMPAKSESATPSAQLVEQIASATVAAVAASDVSGRSAGVIVGHCLDDRHPQLLGRVLVRISGRTGEGASESSSERDVWVPTLAHIVVRRDDRVLLLQPGNWSELVVIGVLDGLRQRSAPKLTAAAMTLRRDEQIEIQDHDGKPLLAIVPTTQGPVLRLAQADQMLEIAGRLTIAATAIELRARGEMALSAGGDVVVSGEEIKLN